jgi:hypothetical protein
LDLAPAHGHGVYAVEEVSGSDWLRGAELLAAVFADEDHGEGSGLDAELLFCGVCGGVALVVDRGDQVPVLEGGLLVLQEIALADVSFVLIGRGEDQEQPVLAAVGRGAGFQDCSLASSAVSCVALA